MTTNKKKIVNKVSKDLFISLQDATDIFEHILFLVKNNSKDKVIKLSGFGSFFYKKTLKRMGRNPKNGESYIIDSLNKLTFKTSNKIKKILN
jgi:nucleoid DNA-binding protein